MSRFSIRDIEHLTGIRAHTLRIWEQRYSLPRPKRSPGNTRYFDDDDLKLLLNVALLNQNGLKISKISRMSEAEIGSHALNLSLKSDSGSAHIQALVAAMLDFNERSFDKVFSSCLLQLGLERTMMEVVFPFLAVIGHLWQSGSLDPAYEHFISVLLRQKIMVALDGQEFSSNEGSRNFLLFLPEGEHHELGLLFGNYMIRSAGHRSLYLGPNLPLQDLENINVKFKPEYILISMTTAMTEETPEQYVEQVKTKFPGATVLLTGRVFLDPERQYPQDVFTIRRPEDMRSFL